MAKVEETRCRLLRELVEENIEMVRGIKPRPFKRRFRPAWLWKSFLVVGLIAVFVSSHIFSSVTSDIQPPPPAANGAMNLKVPFSEPQPFDRPGFSSGVKKIVLDAGHGGDNLGAVSPHGIAEKDVTLDIALRLRRLIEEASFEVLMTREKDEAVTLAQRASFANASGADLFVSIHINWIKTRRLRFVETYYLGPTGDPLSIRLASIENRESGYSLSDFRRLLEGIYMDARWEESRKLAQVVQRELFGSLARVNPALENRGVKTAPFIVLVATETPAILVEVSCLSNKEEARLLASPDYRQKIAQGLFDGIRSYADTLNPPNHKSS